MAAETEASFLRQHVVAASLTVGVTVVLGLIWAGIVAYLDTRHTQREEHNADLAAYRLEQRCARLHDRYLSLSSNVKSINQTQSRLRNYNGRAPEVSYLTAAREDTIADLETEKGEIKGDIDNLPTIKGCEDF